MLKRIGHKLLEALTSPEVVAAEKTLAIKIALKLAAGTAAGALVTELLNRLA